MDEYHSLIKNFLNKGYQLTFYMPSIPTKNALILRHDIDFDIEYAYELSKVEDSLEVKSTYFFLMRSHSYNLFEPTNFKLIKSIISRGHQVSIHFDPTIYEDIEAGFSEEKKLFEMIFNVEVKYISIHRPSEFFLNNPNAICGVNHTYNPIFFKQLKYFADSQGSFRFGHPLESEEFQKNQSIQLLIHPIWWATKSIHPLDRLNEFLNNRIENFKNHMALNCIPYKKYLEESS